jgi:uncharacterized protein YxeA
MKKIIMILIVTVFTVAVYGQTETYYNYAQTPNWDTKTFYVSNIVSCTIKKGDYGGNSHKKTVLTNQWHDYLKAEGIKPNFTFTQHLWDKNKNEVSQKRIKQIGEYKSRGFRIVQISGFSFDD